MKRTPSVLCIGAGRFAASFLPALAQSGYTVCAVISRTNRSAARLAKTVGAPVHGTAIPKGMHKPDIILFAVPDDAIAKAAEFAAHAFTTLRGTLCLHHSGSLTVAELSAVERIGARAASLHIMQTFSATRAVPLHSLAAAVEAASPAVRKRVAALAKQLGMHPITVPADKKPLYHLAGVFVCNFMVGNYYAADELLATIGIPEAERKRICVPIMLATLVNLAAGNAASALTGPVARGDAAAVKRHLRAVKLAKPPGASALMAAYKAESGLLLSLLLKAGKSSSAHRQLQQLLNYKKRP